MCALACAGTCRGTIMFKIVRLKTTACGCKTQTESINCSKYFSINRYQKSLRIQTLVIHRKVFHMVNIVCVMAKTGEGGDSDGGYGTPGNTPGCGKMPPTERPRLRNTRPMKLCCDLGCDRMMVPCRYPGGYVGMGDRSKSHPIPLTTVVAIHPRKAHGYERIAPA